MEVSACHFSNNLSAKKSDHILLYWADHHVRRLKEAPFEKSASWDAYSCVYALLLHTFSAAWRFIATISVPGPEQRV